MKPARSSNTTAGRRGNRPAAGTAVWESPLRREWPDPMDISPVRVPSVGAFRAPSEQPVRPVPGWRLPSGQLLVEYALRAGLASSPLLVRLPLIGGGAVAKAQSSGAAEPVAVTSLASLARGIARSQQTGPGTPSVPASKPARRKRGAA